jgi:hypothetical protein
VCRWGTLRHASNIAFAATIQAKLLAANGLFAEARQQRCWARSQLLYAAGNNPIDQSYIIGYVLPGKKAADRPHHRSSSCSRNYSVPCNFDQLYAPVSDVATKRLMYALCSQCGLFENLLFLIQKGKKACRARAEPTLIQNQGF